MVVRRLEHDVRVSVSPKFVFTAWLNYVNSHPNLEASVAYTLPGRTVEGAVIIAVRKVLAYSMAAKELHLAQYMECSMKKYTTQL